MTRTPVARGIPRKLAAASVGLACATTLVAAAPVGVAASYPSDAHPPSLLPLLAGYNQDWISAGPNNLKAYVVDPDTLSRDDQLTVWINNHATARERFTALQDSTYQNATNTAYDQSYTLSTGMGALLSRIYVNGRNSGALPKVSALINSSNGTAGAYVGTGAAKTAFSHPRPFLPSDPSTPAVPGDDPGCAPATVNGSAQQSIRVGKPYADARGNLTITRVAQVVDKTHQFSPHDVALDPAYGSTGICTGGSFPSGHTTTAYQAGITLATLLPELAPEILARASENGNDRIVLGVHYPLDIMGGRIDGEAALAARWSDMKYRTEVLEPARAELVNYLEKQCGATLATCIAGEKPYTSNPYGGQQLPGGTDQIVRNRSSAVAVYRERMTYGFPQVGNTRRKACVPAGAENLLLTTFPTLSDTQRESVLAQTEIASGYPLDQTNSTHGSWERLDLAAATSATVLLGKNGKVTVVSTGGRARVEGDATG